MMHVATHRTASATALWTAKTTAHMTHMETSRAPTSTFLFILHQHEVRTQQKQSNTFLL